MATKTLDEEIGPLLEEWNRSILDKDVAAAAELRADDYSAELPEGGLLTKEEELALIASPDYRVESAEAKNVRVSGRGDEATAVFENLIAGEYQGERINALYKYTISFRRADGRWRATGSRLEVEAPASGRPGGGTPAEPSGRAGESPHEAAGAPFTLGRLLPRPVKSWLKGKLRSAASQRAPTFQELAYVPYRPGADFVIPREEPADSGAEGSELPVPPEELWLGYNYPAHGKAHTAKMLEVVYASGLAFGRGDRVLDFGCGAGRMIRHLRDLAGRCEIWGTDISAEHIYWCKQNLSPPFNFATTTKVPHLPFEDRSFRLIYCGSVFTHIDDLADAWLLELRRVLAPEGRLYLTIHDEHTVELFESGRHDHAGVVRRIKQSETYRKAKDSFGMFTVGRDQDSQVFYDTAYFSKTLRPAFDILSVTREAYFYQTAFLLKRK